jgi:hypothetical protein
MPQPSRRARGLLAGAVIAVGVAAFLAYGGGFPNTDEMRTLVCGRELLHLGAPPWSAGATPHPLFIPAIAGTPLNDRYLMVTMALL